MIDFITRFHAEEDCCGGSDCDCESDEDMLLEIIDSETGERFQFYLADEFEHAGEDYGVLVTTDDENPEYVIGRMVVDEDGEHYVETLEDGEDEAVYEAYEALLAEAFEGEDD